MFFVLFWVVAAQLSVFVFLYSIFGVQLDFLPPLRPGILALPLIGTTLLTVAIGYYWFGSLASIISKLTIWLTDAEEESEVLVEGRVLGDDFAWRIQYLNKNRINVVHRECPQCGKELVQRYMPESTVYGPNTTFNPSSKSMEAEADAWYDITGKEKVEDKKETAALTCPDCNFSAPGEKELLEGKDEAISRFRNHIDSMKKSADESFELYRRKAKDDFSGRPTPADIWDAYVETTDSKNILPVHRLPTTGSENSKKSRVPEL